MGKIFNKQDGFSLVELMIVVGIIGLLATLAVPRFQQFQAKARMAEAKNMLNHIYTLQESYHLDTNQYMPFSIYGRNSDGTAQCTPPANAGTIGFEISPCNNVVPRYGYSATSTSPTDLFTAFGRTGAAAANLVCPGKEAHEFWMDESRKSDGPVKVGTTSTKASC
ncbi:MAG: type IV pilin protein [Oligoflexales bacterium]